MERFPVLRTVLWLMLGILLANYMTLPVGVWITLATFFSLLSLLTHWFSTRFTFPLVSSLANVFLGLCLIVAGGLSYIARVDVLPPNHIQYFLNLPRPVFLTGKIVSEVHQTPYRSAFVMHVEVIDTGGLHYPVQGNVEVEVSDSAGVWAFGDRVRIKGRLRAPEEARNPFAFDRRTFLARKGIHGVVRVWRKADVDPLGQNDGNWFLLWAVFPVKRHIENTIDTVLSGNSAGLLKGILLGDRQSLPSRVQALFADVGVVHVLAVSGLHVGLIAFIMLLLFQSTCRMVPGLPFGLPYVLTSLVLIYYVILVGAPPSAMRASIMVFAFFGGIWLERKLISLNTLAIAALFILVLSPQMLFTVGFQLSFTATFAILYLHQPLKQGFPSSWFRFSFLRYIIELLIVSCAAVLGTIPVLAYTFNQISLISVIANLFVIPQMMFVVALGLTSVVLGAIHPALALPFLAVDSILLQFTLWVVECFSAFPYAAIKVPTPSLIFTGFYYGLLLTVFHVRQSILARKALVWVLLISASAGVWSQVLSPDLPGERLQVTFLDVGQGDCSVIEFPNGKTMLIDGGDPGNGYRVILPYLWKRGIHHVDYVVNTHPHRDHLGGIMDILPHISIGEALDSGQPYLSYTYLTYLGRLKAHKIPRKSLKIGDTLKIDPNCEIKCLHPDEKFITNTSRFSEEEGFNLNNVSVILKIEYGSVSFLFTGDAEQEVDEWLIQRFLPDDLRSTVIKVPHHGSRTSSTVSLLRWVRPRVAVIQCGVGNKFGHPDPVILQRYRQLGTRLYRTDVDGAIRIQTDGHQLLIEPTLSK